MSTNRDDSVCPEQIHDAIAKIQAYTKGVSRPTFQRDTLVQGAVIRQIEIIGEAAKRLSEGLMRNNSHIARQDIAGMRNKLIHNYFGVDVEKVWLTVKNDMPTLKKDISRILKPLGPFCLRPPTSRST